MVKSKLKTKKKKKLVFKAGAKCRFCREKIAEIDYKDTPSLQKLVTGQGKIFSRKRSGNCAKHQRSAKRAVKRARFLALMPFVG
jgi:small subunit ribosomal protein S18